MRLTLRTLLAYLDDILEPADTAMLSEKIAENPNANELTHRIRDCMTKPRLPSPAIHGTGVAADANSVSEYLDNTLAVERMPEFERTCLESDVHLSEVASCHQILTMVLGEPAEVDEQLRKRAYGLDHTHSQHGVETTTTTFGNSYRRIDPGASSTLGAASGSAAAQKTPPAYADEESPAGYYGAADSPRAFVWPVVLMLVAGFLIMTAVLTGLRWFNHQNQQVASVETVAVPAATPPVIPATPVAEFAPEAVVAPPAITAPPVLSPALPAINASPAITPQTTIHAAPDSFATAPAPPVTPMVVVPPPLVPTAADEQPTATDAIDPLVPSTTVGSNPAPEQLASNDRRDAIGMTVAGDNLPVEPIDESAVEAETEEEKEALPQDVARSVVEDQVIAIWNTEKLAWTRLPVRAPLRVGQRFRNLPTFRPQLLLVGGLQMTLDGNADFSFGEPSGVDTPRVNFSHGRALFMGMGQAPSRVELDVAGRIITVQQGDPSSEFAVEVIRTRTPGSNPRTASRHHVVKIWSRSGRIGVSEGEEETRAVEPGQMWIGVDQRAAVIGESGAMPKWTAGPKLRNIDRDALLDLEPLLTEERSLTLSLLEAAKNRRTDIRSLAARCLAALGRFEPLVESLGDQKQHTHWPEHVGQLRSAVNQHPESSALVTQALRRVTGPDADVLMQLLGSYSPLQLADGGAEQLIDELENESLEVRVVAIETLKHITGMSQLYRADRPAAQRQAAVQKWRGRLAEGEALYAEQPLIFSGNEEE